MKAQIPLSEAAFELGRSWHATWRLALIRELVAEKRGGRWYVTVASVQMLKRRSGPDFIPAA